MWKELIKARLGDGSHPRRASLPRFRGQFEQLETRTVLSATIGVMAIDFEAGTIAVAVWEGHPPLPEPPLFAAFHPASQFDGIPIGESFAQGSYGSYGMFAPVFKGGPGPLKLLVEHHENRPWLVQTAGGVLDRGLDQLLVDIETPHSDNSTVSDPLSAKFPGQQDSAGVDADHVGSDFINVIQSRRDLSPPPPPLRPLNGALPSFPIASQITDNDTLSTRSSLGAHDAAFDEYSPESLLLAASADEDDDLDSDEDEDELKVRREKAESTEEPAIALVGSDAAEALDALDRERAAIDAVLTELHDLNLHQEEQSTDTAQSHDQSKSTQPHKSSENYLPSDVRGLGGANFSQAAGGMVLLEPTGDANSSAYDLTAVFTGEITRPHNIALGLEATVGLQQAFDVGSNERFETSAARTPVAQPVAQSAAATAQPSVSAENAPAKKSEQPS